MSTHTHTFTLQVPATNHDINELVIDILTTCRPDERITLKYGTCKLLCRDEAERREFEDMVTVKEACETLFASKPKQRAKLLLWSQDPPVTPEQIAREVEGRGEGP